MKVADAVAFAHSRGIIHRDLKPENVMLGDFGEVLVMDWGLALAVGLAGGEKRRHGGHARLHGPGDGHRTDGVGSAVPPTFTSWGPFCTRS